MITEGYQGLAEELLFRLGNYMDAGGLVMWPLCCLSLVMWLLIIERLLFLGQLYQRPGHGLSLEQARKILAGEIRPEHLSDKAFRGEVGQLMRLFLDVRCGNAAIDSSLMAESVKRLNRSLGERLVLIGVLAAVAPLLGLLGTVLGMITTFDVLAVFGTGNARGMAGGISAALITTQTGLLVAIPGLYMKNFIERRSRNLAGRISGAGLYLQRHLQQRAVTKL